MNSIIKLEKGGARTLQACQNCRRRKTKCPGERPTCRTCARRREQCKWPITPIAGGYFALLDEKPTPTSSPGAAPSQGTFPVKVDEPSAELIRHMCDIFFRAHHDVEFCSFIHRPSFEAQTYKIPPFLLHAIISLSALSMSDAEASSKYGFDAGLQLSDHYFQKARCYSQAAFDIPTVDNVQANLILALRELLASTGPRAWMYAGIGIRMSQAMRLGKEYNQRHLPREKEIRRRTHWACLLMDRLVSFCTARPMTMRIVSVNIQLPCPENAFIFEEDFRGPTTHDIDVSEPTQLELLACFAQSVKIWGSMTELFVNGGRRRAKHAPTDPEGWFFQRSTQMQKWQRALPERMQWSHQNYRRHQSLGQGKLFVTMHMVIHHTLCVAHQEYLPQLDAPALMGDLGTSDTQYDYAGLSLDHRDEHIISVCLHNAEAISSIAAYLESGSECDRAMLRSAYTGSALMTAASVHLWKQYTNPDPNDPMANYSIESARLSLNIIKSWRHSWKCAHAWTESLEMLFKLYQFAYGTNSQLSQALADNDNDGDTSTSTSPNPAHSKSPTESGADQSVTRDGSGYLDPHRVCQRLYDKMRNTMISPLESSATKKRHMRVYLSTLWQHMWTQDVLNGVSFDASFSDLSPDMLTAADGVETSAQSVGVWSNIDQGGLFEF
ncbi:hypothetical protein NA57DRAFT_51792 [Rhizodiscina lignyota]|uniref:Zn(2)-C6 fungal-type domain-containing protein n=1 Tax=Rhizodiscina lignyota TaxID=1504668 RepID=A0A9P4IRX2_9PEZI|nr:hypothetical protein NA57DRAFT_51792 [Rhizodiscina lignyota]